MKKKSLFFKLTTIAVSIVLTSMAFAVLYYAVFNLTDFGRMTYPAASCEELNHYW